MEALVDLAGAGATSVMYLLIALSAIQVALILERASVFYRTRAARSLDALVRDALATGNLKAVMLNVQGDRSLEGRALAAGVAAADRGPEVARAIMNSAVIEQKLQLERGLSFLGTLGNNAPFVGLFGTVLGIIHAMVDMSTATGGQASRAVLGGISEALIATATGLLVALPAVAAFNYFQRQLKTRTQRAEALGGELIAHVDKPASHARKAA